MSATPLPSLAPGVSADALAVIPSRLLKRAEKLAADSDSWQVTLVDDGFRVEVGTTTVTYVDKFECSCLISPKCAHIGAVCMAAPIAADAEDSDESPAGGVDNPAADKATTTRIRRRKPLGRRNCPRSRTSPVAYPKPRTLPPRFAIRD